MATPGPRGEAKMKIYILHDPRDSDLKFVCPECGQVGVMTDFCVGRHAMAMCECMREPLLVCPPYHRDSMDNLPCCILVSHEDFRLGHPEVPIASPEVQIFAVGIVNITAFGDTIKGPDDAAIPIDPFFEDRYTYTRQSDDGLVYMARLEEIVWEDVGSEFFRRYFEGHCYECGEDHFDQADFECWRGYGSY